MHTHLVVEVSSLVFLLSEEEKCASHMIPAKRQNRQGVSYTNEMRRFRCCRCYSLGREAHFSINYTCILYPSTKIDRTGGAANLERSSHKSLSL